MAGIMYRMVWKYDFRHIGVNRVRLHSHINNCIDVWGDWKCECVIKNNPRRTEDYPRYGGDFLGCRWCGGSILLHVALFLRWPRYGEVVWGVWWYYVWGLILFYFILLYFNNICQLFWVGFWGVFGTVFVWISWLVAFCSCCLGCFLAKFLIGFFFKYKFLLLFFIIW